MTNGLIAKLQLPPSTLRLLDGCPSGRRERLAKPSTVVRRSVGSNPTPSVAPTGRFLFSVTADKKLGFLRTLDSGIAIKKQGLTPPAAANV